MRSTDTTLAGGSDAGGSGAVRSTDTTLAGGSGDSGGSGARSSGAKSDCPHGQRPDGTCRACPDPNQFHNGTECVDKTDTDPDDPSCPAGQVYFSSYGGCRPRPCQHGVTSTGYCQPAGGSPTNTIPGNPVAPACPADESYFVEYRGCRKTECDYGRVSSTGYCRVCESPTQYHDGTGCVERPFVQDPSCPTGQQYYDSYGGCRPGSCPYGRDNQGTCLPPPSTGSSSSCSGSQCLPTPSITSSTSCGSGQVQFTNGLTGSLLRQGCRPASCPAPNGRNLFTGWCRACDRATYLHDGNACMEAPGTDATSNTLCPASGFMYNGFYNRCIEISCSGGRDPATGRCITATTPGSTSGPLAPPTGVSAVGYTSAVSGVAAGKAHMSWVRSITSGVDGYRIRYAVWRQAHLSRLLHNGPSPESYIVQVQAYKNDSRRPPLLRVVTHRVRLHHSRPDHRRNQPPGRPTQPPRPDNHTKRRTTVRRPATTYTYHVCADGADRPLPTRHHHLRSGRPSRSAKGFRSQRAHYPPANG